MHEVDIASQFLADLALERMGGVLTGFDFAAGKFPEEAEMFVGGALGDEHAAIPFDECTDYGNGAAFGHHVSSGVFRRTWQGQSSAMADRLGGGVGAASGVACASNRAERERVLDPRAASGQGARTMATDFSAKTLSGISLVGHSEGLVKSLGGFRKDRHSVPDAVNAATQAFVARLGEGEIREESEKIFQAARAALGYKRTEISLSLGNGQALLTAKDFVWELAISLHDADSERYRLVRTLHSLRSSGVIGRPEFDSLWVGAFSTLVFTLRKGVAVEAVIDAVENLDQVGEERLSVNYPSHCRDCVITVAGVDAQVRCTGATLEVEFSHGATPRELIEKFAAVREAFLLTRMAALVNLT